ncbi:MAG: methyltransferase domain-containing protein [Patescibacteria group bacterium]
MPTDPKTIKAYDDYAARWANRLDEKENLAHEYLEKPAMYAKLPDLKGKDVLCLGCGAGQECLQLAGRGARVIGTDISSGLIDLAKQKYPHLDFRVMDMEKLDFPDDAFDYVYSSLVMHYVKNWGKTLHEVYRVLKNNGTFLFSTHHPVRWGMESIKDEDKHVNQLSYIKHKSGKAEIHGDYLNTRKVNDLWFGDFQVTYYHKPLSEIMKEIREAGFEIVDFLEPKATEGAKKLKPSFYEIHQKIPMFMIFELKKS